MQRLKDKVTWCINRYNKQFNTNLDYPDVTFKLGGTTTVGRAYPKFNRIDVNPGYYRKYPDDAVNDTIPHEVAHIIVDKILPYSLRDPHGPEWQAVCSFLGGIPCPISTKKLSFTNRLFEMVKYRCYCSTHSLTKIRANRVNRGETLYRCKDCKFIMLPEDVVNHLNLTSRSDFARYSNITSGKVVTI